MEAGWMHRFLSVFDMNAPWADERMVERLNMSLVFFCMLGSLLLLLQLKRQARLSASKHLLEEEVRRQRDDLQLIFDTVPTSIWYKNDQNVTLRMNNRAAELLGGVPSDFEGVPGEQLYGENAPKYHQDDLEVIRTGRPKLGIIEPFRTSTGETRWMSTDKMPYYNEEENMRGVLAVATDITDYKCALDLIAKNEERLTLAVTGLNDGLWDWNLTTGDIYYSPRFMSAIGYGPEELPHRIETFADLLHPDDLGPTYDALERNHRDDVPYYAEYRLRHKDGHYIWCKGCGLSTRDAEGKAVRMTGFTTDISERRAAEEKAWSALQEAERANRMKSEFLATMSHEIRTPMNGILGMTELLLETELTKKQEHYATTVIHSAESLLGIINDILDFSKIEAGKIEMEEVPFNLLHIVESASELLAVKAREKALEMIVRYAPGTPRHLIGDPMRIRQIISNLLSNAIKFTERGHILLNVESYACPLDHRQDDHVLLISVTDTGIGIAEEARQKIFEKFTQADPSTTRKFGGTGLGLSITKQLAELMGGEIGLESEPDKGSTFWFTMALRASGEEIDNLAEFGPSESVLQNVRVLLVDDVAINNKILAEQLAAVGMVTQSCESAAEAIRLLKRAQRAGEPYHMMIADYLMPEINGEELARQVKADPEIKDVAIIMLTCTGGRGFLERFEKAGFSSLLSKPVRVQPLLETVATVWEAYRNGHTFGLIVDDTFARRSRKKKLQVHFPGANILLAEDNRVNQEFASEMLKGLGCNLQIATTGSEVMRKVMAEPFDMILMDCQMPEMDGFEASSKLAAMKRDGDIPNIPIIALTANALKGDRERCLQAGMIDYVTKPLRREQLARLLQKWLPERPMDDEALARESLNDMVVLMAEDNRINLEFTTEMLEGFGCRVITAKNGLECVIEAKRDQPYDVILMDIQMPEMDGLAATRQIRELQEKGTIGVRPIIALTANAMNGDREMCLQAGMDDYLSKPVQREQLKAALLKWIPEERRVQYDMRRHKDMDITRLIDRDIMEEARAVLNERMPTVIKLFINNTEFALDTMERDISQQRDPYMVYLSAHSLKASNGYMGACRMVQLLEDLEKAALRASTTHGDITKLWPLFEEMRFVWRATRTLFETTGSTH